MILPAVTTYMNELSETAIKLNTLNVESDLTVLKRLSSLYSQTVRNTVALENEMQRIAKWQDNLQKAEAYRDCVIPAMNALRASADEMELLTAKKYWPFPTYADLLFSEN